VQKEIVALLSPPGTWVDMILQLLLFLVLIYFKTIAIWFGCVILLYIVGFA
jgi:hypothetical protein